MTAAQMAEPDLRREYLGAWQELRGLERDPHASQSYTALLRHYCFKLDNELLLRRLYRTRRMLLAAAYGSDE